MSTLGVDWSNKIHPIPISSYFTVPGLKRIEIEIAFTDHRRSTPKFTGRT